MVVFGKIESRSTDKRRLNYSQLWFKISGCLSALTVVLLQAWQEYRVNVHTHQVPRQPAMLKNQNWKSCQQKECILTSPKLDQAGRPSLVAATNRYIWNYQISVPNMQLSPRDWETTNEIHGKISMFGSQEQENNSSDKQNVINCCLLSCVLNSFLYWVTRMPSLKLWLKNVSVLIPASQVIPFDIVTFI